jgi:hypothetical protein
MRVFLLSYLCSVNSIAVITNCNKYSVLEIKSLHIQPPNVYSGQNITLRVNYRSPVDIMGGMSLTTTRYNYVFTNSVKDSICKSVVCPIQRGQREEVFIYNIPVWLTGKINTRIIWNDFNNTPLLCLDISLKIKSKMN